MTTLNQLTYDLHELVRQNLVQDDYIDSREIQYWVHTQRALWLRNALAKGNGIDDVMTQTLGCVDLALTDASECCNELVGCKILRSVNKIPTPLSVNGDEVITRVAPINIISRPFSHVSYARAIHSGNGRFNNHTIFSFLRNDYLWLITKKVDTSYLGLDIVSLSGIFEDPTQAKTFVNCSGTSCYSDDDAYPVPANFIDYIKAEILKSSLMTKIRGVKDEKNDYNFQPSQQPLNK